VAVLALATMPATQTARVPPAVDLPDRAIVPAQALVNFLSCTMSDGSSCLNGAGGLTGPLDVGTTLSVDIETSVLGCGDSVTAYVSWGDGTSQQSLSGPPGPIGPFTHTYESGGNFPFNYGDSCDGASPTIMIQVNGGLGGVGNYSFLLAALAVLGGLAALGLTVASLRPIHAPKVLPPTTGQVPATATYGSIYYTPEGGGGSLASAPVELPAGTVPPGGWPPWALDYRRVVPAPDTFLQGWGEMVQKFQLGLNGQPPRAPDWPTMQNPRPPTNWPGIYCEARVNPSTGLLRWWNPVDGTYPWG
jgi:hypothetical protein